MASTFSRGRLAACAALCAATAHAAPVPTIRSQGSTAQLMVDNQPFLILGGELHNSSASDLAYLQTLWPRLRAAGLNTVIAPVEWDQIEPAEGRYDFHVLDGLLKQARANNMKLVLLWFGAWKNSMSTYAPRYIKQDPARYAKARDRNGVAQDILSPFDPDNLAADQRAFSALMAHLKSVDHQRTVIMVQVENEIGMLPDARDHSPAADSVYNGAVPARLIDYLQANRTRLHPQLKALWEDNGARTAGTWQQVFGASVEAEEVFQAWAFASFTESLTAAGKAAYPLPMYVNAALNRPGKKPGEYPSGGPMPHLFDVWKAGAPSLDVLAMDTYFPDFTMWAKRFQRHDNFLFIPEANNASRPENGANAFYAIGELGAVAFSPFGIDSLTDARTDSMADAYRVLRQITPLIFAHQGKPTMRGFRSTVAYDGSIDTTAQKVTMGGYTIEVGFVDPWIPKDQQTLSAHGGLIIALSNDEFLVAGRGLTLRFQDASGTDQVGIDRITEGSYVNGAWREGRWLNGDESHQGRHVKLDEKTFGMQRVRLYKYR
jgi:beta-galactosidase GanA